MIKAGLQLRSALGFTLVELLAALAVLSILLIALLTSLEGVELASQREESQTETRQSGRAIIDYISRELRAASLPANLSDTSNLQFVVNPDGTALTGAGSSLPAPATYFNPQALFWQIPVLKPSVTSGVVSNTTLSNVMAEVGYFVRWNTSTASNPRAVLCRLFVAPYNYTATGGITAGSSNADYLILSKPTAWLTSTVLDNEAPGTQTGQYQGWFADNVIALWVRCLDPNGNTIIDTAIQTSPTSSGQAYQHPYAYDSRQGYSYVATGGATTIKSGFYNPARPPPLNPGSQILATLPSSVEVALVILSSRGASRLTAVPAYTVTPPSSATPNPFWTDINNFIANLPKSIQSEASVYSSQIPLDTGT